MEYQIITRQVNILISKHLFSSKQQSTERGESQEWTDICTLNFFRLTLMTSNK